jgi:TolA-binding protein
VIDNKDIAFLHPDALLKSGVCLETLNQSDKARENYRKIVEDFGDTTAAQSAKTFLRALEAKTTASTPAAG